MEQSDEPLARRLRYAALDRTRTESERVDDFVLDADGVIDLRDFDRADGETSIATPAAALASIRGQLGSAAEVSDLYDESEPERPRWRRSLRSWTTARNDAPSPAPRPSSPVPTAAPRVSRPDADTSGRDTTTRVAETDPEIDLTEQGRPTAECPQCAGLAHRDLLDRVSQVEFYSCDVCSHMWQQDCH